MDRTSTKLGMKFKIMINASRNSILNASIGTEKVIGNVRRLLVFLFFLFLVLTPLDAFIESLDRFLSFDYQ